MIFFHVFLDPSLYITCFPRKGASGTTLDDSGMCPGLMWTCWQRETFLPSLPYYRFTVWCIMVQS